MADHRCFICGDSLSGDVRFVFVRGGVRIRHCSEACLRKNVRAERRATAAKRRRWFLGASLALLAVVVGHEAWRRFTAPGPQWISYPWPDVHRKETLARPEPIYFGPAWPPTDDDWKYAFAQAGWVYPLPGPARREARADAKTLAPEMPRAPTAVCRQPGHCGVDLGGELWGEHVYAARDGIVDRVHFDGAQHPGGNYVRLSHFGGMVFTYYFHLAAAPRGVTRGRAVSAGSLIGLLGDTGLAGAPRHLHFALVVRPSPAFPEVYWDPAPLMSDWPLRMPPRGTVAGLAAPAVPPPTRGR